MKINIDKNKCIKCNNCIEDCVCKIFKKGAYGYPELDEKILANCLGCTHCMAVCPTEAISLEGKNPTDAFEIKDIDSENILQLIRQRRSIRQYKKDDIPDYLLEKLKDMLPFIPTGCNQNSIHFSIVKNRNTMDELREYTLKSLLNISNNKLISPIIEKFLMKYKKALIDGEDIIFRDAPSIIVVSAPIFATCANQNPIIALSYIELYAQSLGLGTCYCGFGDMCFKFIPELSQMIGITDGYKPVYVMTIGLPDVKYYRTTLPDPYTLNFITNLNGTKMSLISKFKRYFYNFFR